MPVCVREACDGERRQGAWGSRITEPCIGTPGCSFLVLADRRYKLTAPSSAPLSARNLTVLAAASTTFRAKVALFRDVDGKLASLEPVGDTQDTTSGPASGSGSQLSLCPQAPPGTVACATFGWVQPGQAYAVAMAGFGADAGSFALSWSF
jgi:hypothetical protein